MNILRPLTAVLLPVAVLVVSGCATPLAGTALPAAGATLSTPSTVTATVTSTHVVTEAVTTDPAAPTVSSRVGPDPATSPAVTSPATTSPAVTSPAVTTTNSSPAPRTTSSAPASSSPVATGTVDAITQRWILGMCTDLRGVLVAVFDLPESDDTYPLARYRQDYVDYYTEVSTTAQRALDGARNGLPPNVPNGEKIHQQFITYLTGLQDIAASGAALIAKETAAQDITADITQLSNEIEDLGNGGAGLGDLSSPELATAVAATPECENLTG